MKTLSKAELELKMDRMALELDNIVEWIVAVQGRLDEGPISKALGDQVGRIRWVQRELRFRA